MKQNDTNALVLRLAAKDLYLYRWMLIAAVVAGFASLLIAPLSKTAFNIGSVTFITTLIAYGVILAMYNIAQERRDKAALFALSLPVDTRAYVRAKLIGTFTGFLIPWAVLTLGAVATILLTIIPDSLITLAVLLLVFFVCTFSVVTAGALVAKSELVTTIIIVVTNMSVTFFMFVLSAVLGVGPPTNTIHWSRPALLVLAAELVVIAVALCVPPLYYSRKREYL